MSCYHTDYHNSSQMLLNYDNEIEILEILSGNDTKNSTLTKSSKNYATYL